MENIIALIPILPFLMGGISASTSLISLYFNHLRKINSYDRLRQGLEQIQSRNRESVKDEKDSSELDKKIEDKELTKWLNYGDLIMGPLKRKLFDRLGIILLTILGSSGLVFVLQSSSDSKDIDYIWLVNLIVFIGQIILIILVNHKNILLKDYEKEFLVNLNHLHSVYYRYFVIPAIKEFNIEMGSNKFKKEFKTESFERKQIIKIITEELNKRAAT